MGRLTHTVSGSIATVRSPAVAPIESLKVHFSPIQEGTGDPSPSNIRPITGWTGANTTKVRSIWDGMYEKGYINASGQVVSSNDTFVNVGYIDVIPNSKIKFRFTRTNISAANIHLFYYNENKEYITDRWIGPDGDINISANTRYIRFQMDTAYSAVYDGKDLSVYYSNEAEIIPVTFPVVGKNKLDVTQTDAIVPGVSTSNITIENGIISIDAIASSARSHVKFSQMFPAGDYTIQLKKSGSILVPQLLSTSEFFNSVYNSFYDAYRRSFASSDGIYTLSFTLNKPSKLGIVLTNATNEAGNPGSLYDIQLELGSTATAYESYSSNNTVYGGYVDLATGNIVATYKSIIFDGSEDEAWNNEYGDNYYIKLEDSKVNDTNYCNVAKYLPAASQLAVGGCKITQTLNFNIQIGNVIGINYDVPGFRNWLNQNNIQLVYALGNSKIIATLTPQELTTFKGYSNFWSNAGDIDVTYQVVESSEMTKERQKIFAGNAPSIHTASGSVANFEMEPGLNRNLKSCKVGFLPVQEGSGDPFPPINQNGSIVGVNNLHNESELSSFKIHFSPIQSGSGDPSPTNVRPITGWTGVTGYKGGKNLLDPSTHYTASHYESQGITFDLNSDGSVTINGTVIEGASSSPQFVFVWDQPITGNYYFCANIPYSGTYNEIYMYDNTVGARCRQWDGVSNGLSSHSARQLCEAQLIAGHIISLVIRISRGTGFAYDNVKCSPMLMASNCTDITFEPYSAPTSYPITFPGVGKNLFDQTKYSDTNNYPDSYNNYKYTDIITLEPNTTYTFASNATSSITSGTYYVIFVNTGTDLYSFENKNFYYPVYNGNFSGTGVINQFTTGSTGVIRFGFPVNEDITELMSVNWQLELGSSATIYEPFINMIYGGYVDAVTGDVYKTHNKFKISDYNWRYISNGSVFTTNANYTPSDMKKKQANTIYNEIKSDSYKTYSTVIGSWSNYSNIDDCTIGQYSPSDDCRIAIKDSRYTDPRVFKSEQGNVEIVYELATPVKIGTISPTSVSLTNGTIYSFWSNADAVTVKTVGNVRPIKGWGKINTIRCGKNLYPFPTSSAGPYAYWVNGSYPGFDTSEASSITEKALNNESVTFSTYFDSTNSNGNNRTAVKIWARDKDDSAWSILGVEGNDIIAGTSGRSSKSITFGDHASITFGMSMAIGSVGSNPMVEYGSSLSDYEPYNGNIFPITFPVQGKNLLDVSNMTHGAYNIGSIPNILEPNTTYTFSVNGDTNKTYRLFAVMEDYNTGVGSGISLNASYINKTLNLSFRTFTTPANIKDYPYLALAGNDSSAGNVPINDIKPQVELGSTATSYEPYDNSIFGGYVDLVTGEVWKTYNMIDLGNCTWNIYGSGSTKFFYITGFSNDKEGGRIICASYPSNGIATINTNEGISANGNVIRFRWSEYSNYTVSELKAVLTGVNAVYELATPQLVTTLTPTQIQALKGTNNILSDANGVIEVKYWSH